MGEVGLPVISAPVRKDYPSASALLLDSRDVSRCARQLLLQARKSSRADALTAVFRPPLPRPYRFITSGCLNFCPIPLWPHRSPVLMSFDGVIRTLQCCFFCSFYRHFSQPWTIPSAILPFKPVICFSFSSCKALTPCPHRDERRQELGSNSARLHVRISVRCTLKAQHDAQHYGLANKTYKAFQTGNYPCLT